MPQPIPATTPAPTIKTGIAINLTYNYLYNLVALRNLSAAELNNLVVSFSNFSNFFLLAIAF